MFSLSDEPILRKGNAALRVRNGMPDLVSLLAFARKDGQCTIGILLGNYGAKANSHVEDRKHLGIVGSLQSLDDRKDGRNRRQGVNDVTCFRRDPGQVEKSVARNVDEGPHGRDSAQKLESLFYVDVSGPQQLSTEIGTQFLET